MIALAVFDNGIHVIVDKTLLIAGLMSDYTITEVRQIAHGHSLRKTPHPDVSAIAQQTVNIVRLQSAAIAIGTHQRPSPTAVTLHRIDAFAVDTDEHGVFVVRSEAPIGLVRHHRSKTGGAGRPPAFQVIQHQPPVHGSHPKEICLCIHIDGVRFAALQDVTGSTLIPPLAHAANPFDGGKVKTVSVGDNIDGLLPANQCYLSRRIYPE